MVRTFSVALCSSLARLPEPGHCCLIRCHKRGTLLLVKVNRALIAGEALGHELDLLPHIPQLTLCLRTVLAIHAHRVRESMVQNAHLFRLMRNLGEGLLGLLRTGNKVSVGASTGSDCKGVYRYSTNTRGG